MKVIDFHTHIFPDPIAQKATDYVGGYYGLSMEGDGTASMLLAGAPADISGFVVHSSATKPSQVVSVNSFIAQMVSMHPQFIGFGTLHDDYEDNEGELQRLITLGMKGIKLHPDFQGFDIDDKKMLPIYEMLQDRLPVLIHVGDEQTDASSPRRLRRVMDMFPRLTIIAAHMGGYSAWDEASEYLYGRQIYFDTSSTTCKVAPSELKRMIYRHGVDKVVFGSDYPCQSTNSALSQICDLGLTSLQLDMVLYKNAINILGIGE